MSFPNGKIELDQVFDPILGVVYSGQLRGPGTLTLKKGVSIFVFLSEEGSEMLHIGCARPNSKCMGLERITKTNGDIEKYVVELGQREDDSGSPYYMALIQDDELELDFDQGYQFMISSANGKAELHIIPMYAAGFKIDLDPRNDSEKQVFWVGRNQWPLSLHFKKGIAFSIYVSEDGYEEVEITKPKNNDRTQRFQRRLDRVGNVDKYIVSLDRRFDDHNQPYYYGVVEDDLNLDMEDGYVFLIFTSKPGKEELQIARNRESQTKDRHDSSNSIQTQEFSRKTESGKYSKTNPRRNSSQVA